jgi:putative transposase
MKELEREVRELRRASEILKSAAVFLRGGARPPLAAMTRFIDDHRSYGIEPICRTLAIAPSSYYASKVRPPSSRAIRDEALSADLSPIHAEHFSVYGVRKVWRVLRREGFEVGRDQVRRLMRRLGLAGETRTKRVRTTRPALASARPADLVERVFSAAAPNRLIYPVVGSMMAATSTGDRRPAIRQMTVEPSIRPPTSGRER